MKVLIITAAFYPEVSPRSFRATNLAKGIQQAGNEVTVCTYPNDKTFQFCKSNYIEIHSLGRSPKDINAKTGTKAWIMIKRVFRRILLWLADYPRIKTMFHTIRYLKDVPENSYDLLISIAVPHSIHWGVAMVYPKKKLTNCWVADCGDPFVGVKYERIGKPFYFHLLENRFLKNADVISVPFEDMIKLFNPKYATKFQVIPQGFDFSAVPKASKNVNNPVPTFIYAGLVIKGLRSPFGLIDYLLDKNIDFKFIIYTNSPHLFSKYSAEVGKRIVLNPYIPRDELLKKLGKADFLVNVELSQKGKKDKMAVPSKLIDYSLVGRPIMNLDNDRLDERLVDEFLAGDYSRQFHIEDLDQYRIENVVQRFLQLA